MRKKKQRKEPHIDESWLLPYADLLTLLLALFIVLFAMSSIDAEKFEELARVFKGEFSGGVGVLEHSDSPVKKPNESPVDIEKEKEEEEKEKEKNPLTNKEKEINELKELQRRINEYIEKSNLSGVLKTQLDDGGLLITILNDVFFDPGSAEVKDAGVKIAKEVSNFLNTDPPRNIVISGHTDNRPMHNEEFDSNWELSAIRAVHFMRLLLENENLDPKKFSAKGFGEYHPIVPNNSEANKAKNRRVEVLILPNFE
ncbi:flagellar motor protein MotB [Virgibacillus necropolis]|uniref:flagellar motor protein MotB n=1 Tax=Virgibacillus necropolis TaxID=163877 RepID=UPI0038502976